MIKIPTTAEIKAIDDRIAKNLSKIGNGLDRLQRENRELRAALRDARPFVAEAAADPGAANWQTEHRHHVLASIDAALA